MYMYGSPHPLSPPGPLQPLNPSLSGLDGCACHKKSSATGDLDENTKTVAIMGVIAVVGLMYFMKKL
jgi:hypothetical protein